METSVLELLGLAPPLLLGMLFGLVAGLVPGISGRIGLLICLPVALWFEPVSAAIFLIAMHSVVHTTGAVPAVLLGLPTSSSEAATVVDGWPMMRSGQGGRAVGAILMSSAIGGALGGIALLLLAPLGAAAARQFTSAEIAALSATGLLAISALSGRSLVLGFASACLGLLAATVGLDAYTGAERFTFGRPQLWDGLNIAAIVAGLYVIPEMLRAGLGIGTARATQTTAPKVVVPVRFADVLAGCKETLRHRWLVLRSTVLGIVVGFIPGLGASVVVWLAYAHACTSTRPSVPFGEGAIEGVVAPEAANNAKEGGAMLPTLLFAVPGTSSMAILMGAFALIGLEIGPSVAARDPWIVPLSGWVILVANVIAFPVCIALAPTLTHLATLHRIKVVPFALMAATIAALAISASAETLLQIVVFGLLGLAMARLNWPRVPFLLGFVIGPILEGALTRTIITVGTGALSRPLVLLILAGAIAFILIVTLRRRTDANGPSRDGPADEIPSKNIPLMLGLMGCVAAALGGAIMFPGQSAILPVMAALGTLVMLAAAILSPFPRQSMAVRTVPTVARLFVAYIGAIYLIGPPLASGAFAAAAYSRMSTGRVGRWLAAIGFTLFAQFLVGEFVGLLSPLSALADLLRELSVAL